MNNRMALAALVTASMLWMQCAGAGETDAGVDAGLGGGTGGGAMGGGGGRMDAGVTCTQVSFPESTYRAAAFVPRQSPTVPDWDWATFAKPGAADGGLDAFGVELWFFGGSANPTFPYDVTLGPTSYGACEVCLTYQEGCDATGSDCAVFFLAQAGQVSFAKADRVWNMGEFSGSGSGVRFVEWNKVGDFAVPGGRCVELATYTLNGAWSRATPDAGSDGGGADAGLDDAGVESDAGVEDAGADGG